MGFAEKQEQNKNNTRMGRRPENLGPQNLYHTDPILDPELSMQRVRTTESIRMGRRPGNLGPQNLHRPDS